MPVKHLLLALLASFVLDAQRETAEIETIHNQLINHYDFSSSDISELRITDVVPSSAEHMEHIYVHQYHHGIPIHSAILNYTSKNGEIEIRGNQLYRGLKEMHLRSDPQISPVQALSKSLAHLNIEADIKNEALFKADERGNRWEWKNTEVFDETIPVTLVYWNTGEGLELSWEVSIQPEGSENWWVLKWSALSGDLLDQYDMVLHCDFGMPDPLDLHTHSKNRKAKPHNSLSPVPSQYNVFALPAESPSHGGRSIISDPSDNLASPFGWHDDNGQIGAEYTITRGNNVYAYEDANNSNAPGFSPDGTSQLNFDFPYSSSNSVLANQSAAITNLFYLNNMMHDIWYHYGFDEASGNFQTNNYGRGGIEGDYVQAEAQDGGGTNNANFATPPDGSNPRMQMYLWSSTTISNPLTVNSPSSIAGNFSGTTASFGPGLPSTPLTADVILAIDSLSPVNDGCEALINSNILNGKIALIDRGSCPFVTKVQEAQNAGAVAVIIVNNVPGAPITMGGTSTTINIPSIMISQTDGNLIKSALTSDVVNATLVDGSGSLITPDGDFDNGIIAHEYGHGISIRIAGGPSTSSCLSNAEQMGEGWSDWFGLMLTMEPGDQGSDVRGIGTYSLGQATTGGGIRPAPYSTDFGVNSYTYGNSNDANISVPHGVGFIFATVLWDLNWALIDAYGGTPDPNLHTGTGGNNIAMRLIIEGLKLQPCSPGMIDGRDAIIAADQILYGGAHNCLIWNVFANRGFGYSADQGSTSSRSDQIEAFDLPPFCQAPTTPPTAAFSATPLSTCDLEFNFTDFSTDIPQSWLWDFGDGTSSTIQNPNHTYASSGSYTVKLVVSNSAGADSTTQTVSINLPATPAINEVSACIGDSIFATATATDLVEWSDVTGTIVATGDTLLIPPTSSPATYLLRNSVAKPSTKIGPSDNSIGGGGYHGTGFHGALNFTANQGCEILSAWVNAQGAGNRTFTLGTGDNNGTAPIGTDIVDQVTVFLVDGPQRIDLNLSVPGPGNYNVGATLSSTSAIYRNNSGTNYPYSEPTGLIDIVSSSATSNPTGYYYYLYDIEVREKACYSDYDTLQINPATVSFSYVDSGSSFYFQDQSVNAFTWNWDFGDGSVSIQQNPVHTYANPGNYLVRLSVNSGVCAFEQNVEIGDPCNDLIDSVQTVNVAQGVYRAYLTTPLPLATDYTIEWKPDTGSTWRSRTFNKANQPFMNINITPWYNNTIAVRVGVNDGGTVTYSCEETFTTPCRPMTLQTVEQLPAACLGDSALVRAGYSGGRGAKSILWSNGATTKRTYAAQGETLTVTLTDATGCSLTDSITASTLDGAAIPSGFTLTKAGPTVFNASFTAPTLPTGATLIGYRMGYRLRGTQPWTNTPLSQNTTISVDFTGSGNAAGNYEFVVYTRYRLNGIATNSEYTCREFKGYNGSGNKSGGNADEGSDNDVVSIYPNPAHDKLYVTAANGSEVTLTDLGGRILGIQTIEQSEVVFDLTGIAMGVYLIEVHSNGEVVSERVVKQ